MSILPRICPIFSYSFKNTGGFAPRPPMIRGASPPLTPHYVVVVLLFSYLISVGASPQTPYKGASPPWPPPKGASPPLDSPLFLFLWNVGAIAPNPMVVGGLRPPNPPTFATNSPFGAICCSLLFLVLTVSRCSPPPYHTSPPKQAFLLMSGWLGRCFASLYCEAI